MNEDTFLEKLKTICFDYDLKYGEFPESGYEGHAIFTFYIERETPDSLKKESDEYLQKLIYNGDENAGCHFD